MIDNRSPSFGPEIEADDVQSMSIYTAGIPAEYGRKMGGVVEINTTRDGRKGLHGQLVLSGGRFTTVGCSLRSRLLRWPQEISLANNCGACVASIATT